MRLPTLGVSAFAAMMNLSGAVNAASYDYSFRDNVLAPGHSLNREGSIQVQQLSAPFGHVTVADEEGGIRFSYASTGQVDGKISSIAFDFLPALQGIARDQGDSPYFYTGDQTPDIFQFISSWGVQYANEDVTLTPMGPWVLASPKEGATPSFFVFGLDNTVHSDRFTLHLRGLPSHITAASLVPRYVGAINTSYGMVDTTGRARILASAVPEPSSVVQMVLGLAAVGCMTALRRRHWSLV